MMQYFEWYLPNTGELWKQLKKEAPRLAELGITAVWIPPAYKGKAQDDVGYGAYDLYDLGEFDQKNTVRTKYGTKDELKCAIRALHENGIEVYLDAVMNHKAGADFKEKFYVKEVDEENRNNEVTDSYEIEGWTGFNFPGRKNRYSDFKWHWYHFTGTDYDAKHDRDAIFKIQGKGKDWSHAVDDENGNYDYLMFANIDYHHPEVADEMKRWGEWVANELDLDGMRLDAVKHINSNFVRDFLANLRQKRGKGFYAVGEYWKDDRDAMIDYLNDEDYQIDLFDVPLHYNMHEAGEAGESYNLASILDGTLVREHPGLAVTFVENHDSQFGQSLESSVADWFKPMAYALILLMKDGYPCVFYGDYYGMRGDPPLHHGLIETLLKVRRDRSYGEQTEYFDHPNTVGFVRKGDAAHPHSGVAVLLSNGKDGFKEMHLGKEHARQTWVEVTGSIPDEVILDENGTASFPVRGGKLAVWTEKTKRNGKEFKKKK